MLTLSPDINWTRSAQGTRPSNKLHDYIPNIHTLHMKISICTLSLYWWGLSMPEKRKSYNCRKYMYMCYESGMCMCMGMCPFSMINADLISDSTESDFILSLLDSCLLGLRARFGESAVLSLQFEQHWASRLLLSILRESKRTNTVLQALWVHKILIQFRQHWV